MRTRFISVVGSGAALSPEVAALAEDLGAALVSQGFGVVCGGLGGVMEAVARGAHARRGRETWPPVVGILPSYEHAMCNDYVDIALPTGMGHARNALVAAAGDGVICVGGAMGALSEVALARKIGRPVVALVSSGGTATLVAKAVESIPAAETVEEAVTLIGRLT